MASTQLASSTSSGGGIKRRSRSDTDNEMLRELIKVLCECLYRSRMGPKATSQLSGMEKARKTKWFGIVSERVQEVERLMSEWDPHMTTIVSVIVDSVLAECWSIRYTLNVSESRGRVYSKLMVLVRSLITTAQALPTSRNRSRNEVQIRFCETDGEPYDVVPPLSEQFCFPSVDMTFGKIDIQVRYRDDLVLVNSIGGSVSSSAARRDSGNNLLVRSIVEDYIGGGRPSTDNFEYEDDADNRRWRRWASESFDERERELAERRSEDNEDPRRRQTIDEEDEDEGEVSAPPSNTRATSNPMAIPSKNVDHHAGQKRPLEVNERANTPTSLVSYRGSRGSAANPDDLQYAASAPATSGSLGRIYRKSSNLSEARRDSFRTQARISGSEDGPTRTVRYSSSFGYSVADLVAYSSTGTPILTALPFAVGSLQSSVASVADSGLKTQPQQPDSASLRTRFLTSGNEQLSSSSPPFPVVFMSAGSLMVSRHSSALALLDANVGATTPTPSNALYSPSPQLPGAMTPPPSSLQQQQGGLSRSINVSYPAYEAALPWVLTPTEMERPFQSMGGSVTLGASLDDHHNLELGAESVSGKNKRGAKNRYEEEIMDDDELALPFFVADEDLLPGKGPIEDNSELGAFVRRCREGKGILAGQESVGINDVKTQLAHLVKHSGLDKVVNQSHEVLTVYEERPL